MGVNVDIWKHIYLGPRKPWCTVNFIFVNSIFALYKYTNLLTYFYTQQTSTHNNNNCFTALCPGLPGWAGTRKKNSPTHHPAHHPIFISFFYFYLLQSIASYLIKLRASQSFCTTSFHVLFGLPLHLEPSTSYSIHFFTQSVSSFLSTCPYHHNLFCCSINIISSIPSLSLNSLPGTLSFTLTLHIHLTILISALWSAISFSFLTGQVSLPCSILLHTRLNSRSGLLHLSKYHGLLSADHHRKPFNQIQRLNAGTVNITTVTSSQRNITSTGPISGLSSYLMAK